MNAFGLRRFDNVLVITYFISTGTGQQLHGHLKLRAKKSKAGDTFVYIRWGKMPVDKLTIFPCQDLKYMAMLMEFVMILVRLYSGFYLDMMMIHMSKF